MSESFDIIQKIYDFILTPALFCSTKQVFFASSIDLSFNEVDYFYYKEQYILGYYSGVMVVIPAGYTNKNMLYVKKY